MDNAADSAQDLEEIKKQYALNPQDISILAQLFHHYYEQHDFVKAESYLRKIDELDGSNVEVKFLLGINCQFQQRYAEAISWYLRAIDLYPQHLLAYANIGHVYMLLNKHDDAKYYFEKAIEINPDAADAAHAYSHLGVLAVNHEMLLEAEQHFQKAIQLQPDNYHFQINLAHAYLVKKSYDQAYEIICNIPDNEETMVEKHLELAKIYEAKGQLNKTIEILKELEQAHPRESRISFQLGQMLTKDHQHLEAQKYFNQAINNEPQNVGMILSMTQLAIDNKDTVKAKEYLQRILDISPGNADAYANLGYVCLLEGNPEGAINCCDICLSIEPHNIHALRFLGHAYHLKGDKDTATKYLLQALELSPRNSDIIAHLGSVHKGVNATRLPRQLCYNSIQGILEQYKNRKSAFDPIYFTSGEASALSQYAYNCIMNCLWKEYKEVEDLLNIVVKDQLSESLPLCVTPFVAQFTVAPETQKLIIESLAKGNEAPKHLVYKKHPKEVKGKMKIGYISPDLNGHVVGFLIQDYFKLHNRDQFEVYAYSLRNIYDEMRVKLEQTADHFKDISDLPAPEAAKLINEDGIHILIDLAGYTSGSKPAILGYQPAPIQAQFIGWAGSMAAEFIQYHINTQELVPDEQLQYYKEQIVYLPESPVAVQQFEIPEEIPKHSEYGLPEDKFIFACFNNTYRIDEPMFKSWMEILKAVPDSVLWLSYHVEETIENLQKAAKDFGVDPERLIFRPFKKLNTDWHHRLADLYLDTEVVSGGTTTILSAWAGLPVLCIEGETPQSRYGSGLMAACQMQELICHSLEEYQQKAIELAQNPSQMKATRDKLKANVQKNTLFDQERWIKQLEKAYHAMWADHVQGHPNKTITISQ